MQEAYRLLEEKVKAATAITWAVTTLCSCAAWAGALNALDQPRMLGAVKATPETMWPVEERLSLPYVAGGDNAPLCAPANNKPVPEAATVRAPDETELVMRARKHWRHPDHWLGSRGGGESAAVGKRRRAIASPPPVFRLKPTKATAAVPRRAARLLTRLRKKMSDLRRSMAEREGSLSFSNLRK